ncbi:unnamed protein product [Caretta caretta]
MVQYQGEEPLGYLQWCLGEIFRERLLLTLSSVLGFHIIQVISGCDLREDNVIQGFYQDSYDGRDFLTLDKETMTWVAADIGAEITKRRWDAEVLDNQQWKQYLEEKCIPWLRSALEYGKETLRRKVRPTARVSDRSSHDGLTTLSCKVSGFYPRDITVTWLKNGESRQQETYSEGILPGGDGTYQTWVTMEIDPKIKAHYSCHVEHESLVEPLSVSWELNNNLFPVLVGVITAVFLIGVIIGVVVWKKKCPAPRTLSPLLSARGLCWARGPVSKVRTQIRVGSCLGSCIH